MGGEFVGWLVFPQCSPVEFYYLVRTLNKVCEQMGSFSEMALKDLKSELLLSVVKEVCIIISHVQLLCYPSPSGYLCLCWRRSQSCLVACRTHWIACVKRLPGWLVDVRVVLLVDSVYSSSPSLPFLPTHSSPSPSPLPPSLPFLTPPCAEKQTLRICSLVWNPSLMC